MKKYETTAGYVTRTETLAKLLELLKEAEDCCYVIAHLHRTEDSKQEALLATGWRAVGQMISLVHRKVIEIAKGKLQ
jgi:hypothetical protein